MTTTPDVAWRLRMQGAALLAVAFLVGLLVGGAAERIRASRMLPPRPMRQPSELPPGFERIGLTEEQKAEIVAIFDRRRSGTDSILQEVMPRLWAITDSIHSEIRAILTPEQAEQLDREFPRGPLRPEGFEGRWRRPFLPDSPPWRPGEPPPGASPPRQ